MDAIEFLERAGSDASIFHGEQDVLQAAVDARMNPALASALVARDADALYRMLGQRILIGMQVPAEEEEAPDEGEGDADERLPEWQR